MSLSPVSSHTSLRGPICRDIMSIVTRASTLSICHKLYGFNGRPRPLTKCRIPPFSVWRRGVPKTKSQVRRLTDSPKTVILCTSIKEATHKKCHPVFQLDGICALLRGHRGPTSRLPAELACFGMQTHRQLRIAHHKVGRHPNRLTHQFYFLKPFENFFPENLQLHLGKTVAHATVNTKPE